MRTITMLSAGGAIFFLAYALKQSLLEKHVNVTGFIAFLVVTFVLVIINKYL